MTKNNIQLQNTESNILKNNGEKWVRPDCSIK